MRKTLLAGNWKMNMSLQKTASFFKDIEDKLNSDSINTDGIDLVIGAPYTMLATAVQSRTAGFEVASQNVHWESEGAFTGEISAPMLKELGVKYAIIGHSERRQYFGETDQSVLQRTKKAISEGIIPIVCVGEVLEDRESGRTNDVVKTQIDAVLKNLDATEDIVIAYEPVWAIGTGLAATSEQAEEVHAFIRDLIKDSFGQELAEKIRILYGGSMKPSNISELLSKPNVDGGLVGGASLKANDFAQMIVKAV